MIDRRPDYLTLIVSRLLEKNLTIHSKDEDGMEAKTTLMTLDVVGHEFFQAIGVSSSVGQPFITSNKKFYVADNKTIYWLPYFEKAEVQFKGKFFLQPDWKEKLQKAVAFFLEKNHSFSVSRIDVSFKFQYEGKFEEELLFKSDFGKLKVRPELHEGKWGRVFAGNSRCQISGYNKTVQMKEVKEDRDGEYINLFLGVLGLSEMPKEPIYHLDLRLTPKSKDTELTALFKKPELDFLAIEELVFKEIKKRAYFPKKIRQLLGLTEWKNPFKKGTKKQKPKRRAKK